MFSSSQSFSLLKVSTLALMSALATTYPSSASQINFRDYDLSLESNVSRAQAESKGYRDRRSQPREKLQNILEFTQDLWQEKQHLSQLGIQSYRISQDMALAILSKNQDGLLLESNKIGNHAWFKKGSVYFKADATNTGL